MATKNLPPALRKMAEAASFDPSMTTLRTELEVMGSIIERHPDAISEIDTICKSFTGSGPAVCPCCQRPF